MPQPTMSEAQWAVDVLRKETDLEKRLYNTGIPEYLRHVDWKDYNDDAVVDGDFSLKDWLIDYCDTWTPAEKMGATILGPAGWGKTFALVALGIDLSCRGALVKYVTYADLVEDRKALFKLERDAERSDDWQLYNRARIRLLIKEVECDVLLLDDVGKEYRSVSGWSDDGLDRLLRTRHAAGKVTFMASNLSTESWGQYNASMMSFLYQIGDVLELVRGRDHRRRLTDAQKARRQRVQRKGSRAAR